MLFSGQVGPGAFSDGTAQPARLGKTGEIIVQELHGRYYETAKRFGLFYSYSPVATVTSANSTATGHIIWNPANSGVNMVLQKVSLIISVTSATMTGLTLGLNAQAAAPTGLTAIGTSGATFLGGASSQAKAYSAATLASTPLIFAGLMHNTAAINTTGVDQMVIDLEGSFIVAPGNVVSLSALGAASAASAVTSTILWEEVPV